tara:strand:- start:879 stop:1025 length:147 start_codon:yes stop_codon:yes gene_type:complete
LIALSARLAGAELLTALATGAGTLAARKTAFIAIHVGQGFAMLSLLLA